MEKKDSAIWRLVGSILGLAALGSLIVLGFGLLRQWNTLVQFSNGFFVAGAIVIILGLFSVTGGFSQRANFPIKYAETAGQASIKERTQRMMSDINQQYGFMIIWTSVGVLLIGISIAIHQLL